MIRIDTTRHAEAARRLLRETLLIGGERLRQGSGAAFGHVNPSTGLVQHEMRLAGAADVERAVKTARAAFVGWGRSKPARRALADGGISCAADADLASVLGAGCPAWSGGAISYHDMETRT